MLLFELRKWLIELDAQGAAIAFPEYPWPAVALLELPLRLDVPTAVHYYVSIILCVLAIDALFAWLLWRSAGGRMSRGLALWLALFPALGPLMVTRYDIVPAVLAGSALLALAAARPATAGVLASLGAGFKIWPALGFAALLVPGEAKSRARLLAGIGITLLALVLASWAAAGWGRLWSPFSLQGKRGLQLEALAALPFLWARYLNPDGGWTVRREDVLCKCHELYGPGVDVALQLTFPALLVAGALAAVLYVRAFRAPAAARTSAVVALLTAVSLIAWLVTARVFSPQYMIWLAAPLAVLGTLPGTPLARRDVALFVAAALLTHLIYPLGYEAAVIDRHPLQGIFLVVATLRDALIIWLGVRLARRLAGEPGGPIPRAALWYLATRLAGLALLVWPETVLLADPRKWLIDIGTHGHAHAFPEYPWPAVALLDLPLRLGVPTALHYYTSVVLFMLAIDALFTWLLWRAGGSRMSRGLWLWLAMFPALGPLVVTRYDLLPAALAGGALLALAAARPATAGALASLGAGLKIWPAVGFAALLVPGERKSRARVLVGICSVLVALALASAAAAGWSRLWSPFSLQGQRGLQLEAFGALPLLWARYFNPDGGWAVRPENVLCKCYELYGPGVDVVLQLTLPALLLAAALVALLHVRAFAAAPSNRTATIAVLLTALSLIAWLVTARVFSPQYMIWLAAPLAVLGTLPGTPLARRDVALFVAAALLTHLIYPLGYEAAVIDRHSLQGIFLVVATLRDALIVWLGVRLALQTWRLT